MYSEGGGHVARSTIFGTGRYAITDVTRTQLGASLTHTLSPSTFYRVSFNQMRSAYDTHPDPVITMGWDFDKNEPITGERDDSYGRRNQLASEYEDNGNALKSWPILDSLGVAYPDSFYYVDAAPFDWTSQSTSSPGSGLRLGSHWGRARDTSRVTVSTFKFDLTNQTNSWSQLKAGAEVISYDFDMNYRSDDSLMVHLVRSKQMWKRKTLQAAFYAQEKLEFRGMIANLGLRLDYYSPGEDWWDYEAYEREFTNTGMPTRDEALESSPTENQIAVSPRVGVSFPITANSKLFFNYGHFRDILRQRELFQIRTRWLGSVHSIGNPNHPLSKTVAYELGYEHSLLDQYLLRLSGYYRDLSNQPGDIYYESIDYEVGYNVSKPRNYGDVRGLEVTLNKPMGEWFRGFVNYTYMIEKWGDFGFGDQYENDVLMADYLRTNEDHYQDKPVANPFARCDLEFIVPSTYGLLGDWHLNLLGGWRAGEVYTWTGGPGSIPGLQNNVRMRDYISLDIRFSKNFQTGLGQAQFFVDITNVLNLKYIYFADDMLGPFEWGDSDPNDDYYNYMRSLHLDKDTYADVEGDPPYIFIPGDDRPGAYRDEDVAFVPIEKRAEEVYIIGNGDDIEPITFDYLEADRRVLGWAEDTKEYYEYVDGTWEDASSGFVDDVLNDKAYIDMPNETNRTFLGPRKILFGIRVSF